MTQTFTPKFVDMVRVTTSTQGSGPLACGPAVAGFTSFAEALTVGDSFYYSVQGVDKPQEREVGRGTLGSNNSIIRQPLEGDPTIFSSGTKVISLVAAAEWYARVQEASQSGGKAQSAATRSALKLISAEAGDCRQLAEVGREGIFRWDPSVPVASHRADPAEGIYVAPSTIGAGAWVRCFDGPLNVKWFGARGDSTFLTNATDDGPAFLAAIAFMRAMANVFSYGRASPFELFVPGGYYWLNTSTLDFGIGSRLFGVGGNNGGSMLKWANGVTGIRTQRGNTSGAAGTQAENGFTSGVTLESLVLRGGYTGGAESEAHGVHARSTVDLRDVQIFEFAGDGFFGQAEAGSGGFAEGNINTSKLTDVLVQGCRNGIYFDSADANACLILGANLVSNRQWGVWDSSFLGNTYVGCHCQSNGFEGASNSQFKVFSHLNGRIYYVLPGQEEWCAVNAPTGTDVSSRGWKFFGPNGHWESIHPTWTAGRIWRSGGSYRTDDLNAANVFIGCYEEGDQPRANFSGPTQSFGGLLSPMDREGRDWYGHYGRSGANGPFEIRNGDLRLGPAGNLGTMRYEYDNLQLDALNGFVVRVNGSPQMQFRSNQTKLKGSLNLFENAGLQVDDLQVVGSRGGAVANVASPNATDAASAQILVNEIKGTLNSLLSRLRAGSGHGLIA